LYRAWLDDDGQPDTWQRCTDPFFSDRDDYPRHLMALAVAETENDRHILFAGSADGEFYRFDAYDTRLWEQVWPTPPVTREAPTPVPCPSVPEAHPVDERFDIDYAHLPQKLGCAIEPGEGMVMAFQPFERGMMFWRPDRREIYVLYNAATWATYDDTWDENQPDRDPDLIPPTGLYQPMRGFGKVWREEIGGTEARIGWATAEEASLEAVVQVFKYGLLLQGGEDASLFVLYYDWTWDTIDAGGQ
jgi:hypothetical protein